MGAGFMGGWMLLAGHPWLNVHTTFITGGIAYTSDVELDSVPIA
jgi:hypothetical protein